MNTKNIPLPCEVSLKGQIVNELNIRHPKVGDLLHMAKDDRHPADLEVALAAHLLETTFEEVVEWPAEAFRPVHRWLAPLVDMSGGPSSA